MSTLVGIFLDGCALSVLIDLLMDAGLVVDLLLLVPIGSLLTRDISFFNN